MKKVKLSPSEMEFIRERQVYINEMINQLKLAQQFELHDYLIAFDHDVYTKKRSLLTNSYGAPKKFQVVYIDSNDVSYIKELNKKGNPVGRLMNTIDIESDGALYTSEYEFEVDPDYTNSVIMMDEENYDSSAIHRMKSDTHKEITAHNKKHRINCSNYKVLADYFDKNVKVGDVLHRSIKTHFTVLEISPIPIDAGGRLKYATIFCKIQTSKGVIKECTLNNFIHSALYTQRPRSYNELKDLK
jgi:hypothetical protein